MPMNEVTGSFHAPLTHFGHSFQKHAPDLQDLILLTSLSYRKRQARRMERDGAVLLLRHGVVMRTSSPSPEQNISGKRGSSWWMESYEHKQMLQADARVFPAYLSNYFRH